MIPQRGYRGLSATESTKCLGETVELTVTLPNSKKHPKQQAFIDSQAKRKVIRAGRRGGKTVGAAIMAVNAFLAGRRVLYATPTADQVEKFWYEVKQALAEPIQHLVFSKNETLHIVEKVGTENRLKAKTAWNADTLRGDYADLLILDEFQLMNEDTWEVVGAPMLLDNDGDAVFIYTPPSLRSAGVSKARDPRHAAKLFKEALADATGRWEAFTFTSHDNPYISKTALGELISDMSKSSYRQEILAEDDESQASWLVYRAFNEAIRKISRFGIPNHWPRYVGHDFGGANPAALFFTQARLPLPADVPVEMRHGDFIACIEYLPGAGRSTVQHVEEFKRLTEGLTISKRVGGSHQEDEIRQGYAAHGWTITEPLQNRVAQQLDRVIGLMELNKVWVFDDLYNYLGELMSCMWKLDNESRPTDKIDHEEKYHLCACARYILSDFQPETIKGDAPIISHSRRAFVGGSRHGRLQNAYSR